MIKGAFLFLKGCSRLDVTGLRCRRSFLVSPLQQLMPPCTVVEAVWGLASLLENQNLVQTLCLIAAWMSPQLRACTEHRPLCTHAIEPSCAVHRARRLARPAISTRETACYGILVTMVSSKNLHS